MQIDTIFDKIIWINTKKRGDRRRNMLNRLEGIESERFEAIVYNGVTPVDFGQRLKKLNNAEIGCFLSHRQIYELIKANGWQKTLILEDDAEFLDGFEEKFSRLYPSVPTDWHMLYFGTYNYDLREGNKQLRDSFKVSQITDFKDHNVYKADRCWLTHAYALDLSCIDYLLAGTKQMWSCLDHVLSSLQGPLNVYAIAPAIIKQDNTTSSIRHGKFTEPAEVSQVS